VTAPTGFQYLKILISVGILAELVCCGIMAVEFKARGYKEGSIVRVQLHNFISYDDAVVYPGPKLNIILGPNGESDYRSQPHAIIIGTGKSALTHAICLVCCGSIKSVGRSDDTSEYVKRNSKDDISFCEVDILRHDSLVTVRRYLSKDNSSSKWSLNSKPATQAQVKQLMASLNIDLNNLCSFMPQDRVGAFTQQSAKGILEKTLESIKSSGERNLHQEQMDLAEEQRTSQDRGREKETQQNLVNTLQHQLDGMKSEVERIRQRAVLEEKLKMFEVKIVVKELQEAGKRLQDLQVDRASLQLLTRTGCS
jgi:structural maintenance of chromosomes protein 5